MSGPTFSFVFGPDVALTNTSVQMVCAHAASQLESASDGEFHLIGTRAPRKPTGAPRGRVGSIFCALRPSEVTRMPDYVRRAFEAAVGWVPELQISAYAMKGDAEDRDALCDLATRVAQRFGGYALYTSRDGPAAPLPFRYEVVARDLDGTLGAYAADAAYVASQLDAIPEERFWLIDARLRPEFWVR